MIGVEVREGSYLVTLPTCILVLTKGDFIQALRRGQWWRRSSAMAAPRRRLSEQGAPDRRDTIGGQGRHA